MKVTTLVLLTACACELLLAEGTPEAADLRAELERAPALVFEEVASPATGARPEGPWLCPNPDGKTYDVLWWYYPSYGRNQVLFAIDLGSGEFNKMDFPDGVLMHNAMHRLAWDGKLYFASKDLGEPGPGASRTGVKTWLHAYDPATNTLASLGGIVPNLAGMPTLILGPDGRLYGAGTCYRDEPEVENRWDRVGVYSYDPQTKQVRNYGPVGPSHGPYEAFGYFIGACDEYIYVADGKIPWYLVAVNIATGEEKILAQAPTGDYDRMIIRQMDGGAQATIRPGDEDSEKTFEYWLYHGQAIPKTGEEPPWPKVATPWDEVAAQPQLYSGQIDPGPDGMAAVWFRPAAGPETRPQGDSAPEWRCVKYGPVEKHPLEIHRLLALRDGRLFGTAHAYVGRFLFDPATGQAQSLGRGGPSIYALAEFEGKVYWSGYSNAPVDVFDPARPWTLDKGGPPGEGPPPLESPQSNPRRLTKLFDSTRVKKMHVAALGEDRRIYFGGSGDRDYSGGGLGWLDPQTHESGGLWRPFSGYAIHWLEPVLGGRLLALGTRAVPDELNENRRPDSAKVFLYDVRTRQVVEGFVPVPGQEISGPVLEMAPGRLVGLTDDPRDPNGSILYGLDVSTREVLYRRKLPGRLGLVWDQGLSPYDFARGPDGLIWTYLDGVMVRIDPTEATVHVVGRVEQPGKITFVGRDMYLTGTRQLRRLSGIVPEK